MPTLPLPTDAPIQGGDLVVVDSSDVLAVLPAFVRESDSAPVRDAIAAGVAAMLLEAQRRGEYAAAQSDVLRATGIYLDGLGADRGVYRQPNEDDPTYRARILVFPDVVTPTAILAAANALLAPVSAIQAAYWEQLDGMFLSAPTILFGVEIPPAWSCFLYDGTANRTPQYPERLYADDAASNGGVSVPRRLPGGARLNADGAGRWFELRVPDLSPLDNNVSFVSASASDTTTGFYLGDGTSALNTNFMQATSQTSDDVYASIVTAVERIKGHSVRWQMLVDSQLAA